MGISRLKVASPSASCDGCRRPAPSHGATPHSRRFSYAPLTPHPHQNGGPNVWVPHHRWRGLRLALLEGPRAIFWWNLANGSHQPDGTHRFSGAVTSQRATARTRMGLEDIGRPGMTNGEHLRRQRLRETHGWVRKCGSGGQVATMSALRWAADRPHLRRTRYSAKIPVTAGEPARGGHQPGGSSGCWPSPPEPSPVQCQESQPAYDPGRSRRP